MTVERAIEMIKKYDMNQVDEIRAEDLVFDDEVRKMCEANSCGMYGKNWMCPPGNGDIWGWKDRMMKYKHAVLFNYVGKLEDSFDFEGMEAAKDYFSDAARELRESFSKELDDFYLLGAGSCSLCAQCSYPDAPCRFPNKSMPSIEACGVFVSETAKKCGFKYINGTNTVTYFGLLLI